MGFINKIKKAIDAFNEDESVEKGNNFEKCVVDLFDKRYFSIIQWSTDIARKHDRHVEADMGPDLVMRYEPTGERFCVECKYRSHLEEGKIKWSYPQQLERYQIYGIEHRLPFFVVIGLYGDSTCPDRMFCIPLEEAKYPVLFPSVFQRFERDPDKNFFWKNGRLT